MEACYKGRYRNVTLCGALASQVPTTAFAAGVGCPRCQNLLRARRGA